MAILKNAKNRMRMGGETKHLVMPAFSFEPTDGMANLIIDAWKDPGKLLERDPKTLLPTADAQAEAKKRANAAGYVLNRAVVITEEEHDNDYVMQSDDEIVFVLPSPDRAIIPKPFPAHPYPKDLLATAKLLMACTPNGI
jgi:hypothetical protein